jgi:hypothetical protein
MTRRPQRELAALPAKRTAAPQRTRLELAHQGACFVGGLDDSLPEAAASDPPLLATGVSDCRARGETLEAQRADSLEGVEAPVARNPA